MKILHLGKYYPPVPGGIETHVKVLCEGLSKKGFNITCVVSSSSHKSYFEKINGVNLVRLGKFIKNAPPINFSLPSYLKKNVRDFDVVHLHMPNPCAEVSSLLAKPKKLVVSYHADIVNKFGAGLYLPIQKKVLRMADRIIVTSRQYAYSSPVLRKFLHKCVVIPYGLDVKKFNAANERQVNELRRFGSPVFLFVGRLVEYKGLKYLLKAVKKVDGVLLLVGEGPLLNSLLSLARKLNLRNRVHFFSNVSNQELPGFYHAADVLILPSITRAEAFGIVQLEAMACGKPVISTRLNTAVDIVNQHLKTGLLVPPSNVDALAEAMSFLGRHEQLRSRLGRAARQSVSKHFTSRLMLDRIVDVYQGLH